MKIQALIVLPVILATAGCLGGEPTEGEVLARAFAAAVENDGAYGPKGQLALDQLDAMSGQSVTSESNIPTSSVSYSGYMGIGQADDGVLGDMEIVATTSGMGSFDGTVGNFVDESGSSVDGALTISSGSIDGSVDPEEQWQIGASIGGTLDRGNGEEAFSGSLSGEFIGANGEHVSGEVREFVQVGNTSSFETVGYFGVSQ